jgi:DNA-binding SARP family transcriptional activator
VAASDWLIDVAWNGAPPASATTRLHGLISDLRRALPTEAGAVILTRGAGYLLDVAGEEIDLFQVRTLMSLARAHRDQGEAAAAAPIMAQALGLWRGTPFDGLECAEVQAEADLIDQARADGLEEAIAAYHELRGGSPTISGWIRPRRCRGSTGPFLTATGNSWTRDAARRWRPPRRR